MVNLTKDGWMKIVMGFTGKAAIAIKESYIAAFNWMAEQIRHYYAIEEEAQHCFAIKEMRPKLKGTIGSRLMNERKNEKRVLILKENHIHHLANPDMISLMVDKGMLPSLDEVN